MPFMKWCPLEWKYGKYENPSKNSYAKNAGFDGWGGELLWFEENTPLGTAPSSHDSRLGVMHRFESTRGAAEVQYWLEFICITSIFKGRMGILAGFGGCGWFSLEHSSRDPQSEAHTSSVAATNCIVVTSNHNLGAFAAASGPPISTPTGSSSFETFSSQVTSKLTFSWVISFKSFGHIYAQRYAGSPCVVKVFDFTQTHRGLSGFVQEVVLHVRCQHVLNMHDGTDRI